MKKLLVSLAMLFSSPAIAADMSIEMLNKDSNGNKMIFSEEIAKIEVGDTITWLPTAKGHNVEIVASPNGMKFRSKNSKKASISFDTPGVYYYWCTPHKGMGMIGFVVVGNDKSNLEAIKKIKFMGKSKKIALELIASL